MGRVAPDDAKTVATGHTITGVFASESTAREAVRRLEQAGMPPDRIGFVTQNVRQAREVAGSYSPQGAIVGALLGAIVVGAFFVIGSEAIQEYPLSAGLGGVAIVLAFTFIGWLAGRARVFKKDEAAELEDDVASGNTLLTVVCDTPDGADQSRAILERAGASEVKLEDSAESV